ncbi:hypothetical protein [Schinkia azotoformans]|uniref:hypothetical protein n=1 Tax=Schinkia azotoformans TaxID=1454 RepID=UPI002DBEC60F|nr:hypothetical protein [Schinkia azotoformans]MEC1722496.1 hypothetical protein [Schinkia azotoformans]MED4415468.1 hypothetical protein [Schinkia azotoformans]
MSTYIEMKNIFITKVQKDEQRTILEVCFENMHEPKYCRLFKATLEKESDWTIRSIAVYDSRKDRFLTVGSLYAPILYEEIKNKILQAFEQDAEFEQQLAQ